MAGCHGNLFLMPVDAALSWRLKQAQLVDPMAPLELALRVELALREYVESVVDPR